LDKKKCQTGTYCLKNLMTSVLHKKQAQRVVTYWRAHVDTKLPKLLPYKTAVVHILLWPEFDTVNDLKNRHSTDFLTHNLSFILKKQSKKLIL
jgi:hypothetical protein